jgi:hypothetical protein
LTDVSAVPARWWLVFAALALARCAPVDPIQQKCLYQAEAAVLPDMNADNPETLSQISDLRAACEQVNGE